MPAGLVCNCFTDVRVAASAVYELIALGFEANDISVVMSARTRREQLSAPWLTPMGSFAASRAIVVGGVYAAGPLASVLRDDSLDERPVGLLDSLMRVGMPEREAKRFVQNILKGGALICVRAARDDAEAIRTVLRDRHRDQARQTEPV